MVLFAGLAAIFLALTLVVVALGGASIDRQQVHRGLAAIRGTGLGVSTATPAPESAFSDRVLTPVLGWGRSLGRRLSPGDYAARIGRRLDHAGNPRGLDVERVLAYKGVALVGGAAVALLMFHGTVGIGLLAAVGGAAAGFFLPDLLVYNTALKRQDQIQRALADALDMLTISVEAGLSFDSALAQVARNVEGPVAEEFARVLHEIQVGKGRTEAFRDLLERTNVPELKTFVTAIVQADSFGIPIANVLRTQSKEMRVKRRQRAEEAANKVPTKIMIPLMLCIMPSLFVAIIGPGAIRIIHAFSNHVNVRRLTAMTAAREVMSPQSVADAIHAIDRSIASGHATVRSWPTGFDPLDFHLGGGLHAGELTLLIGPQSVGKTTFALQLARNIVTQDPNAHVIYVCYEHDAAELTQRLIAMEAGLAAGLDAPTFSDIRQRLMSREVHPDGIVGRLDGNAIVHDAVVHLESIGDRLHLVRGRGDRTGLADIAALVQTWSGSKPVVVVDYLQKVHVPDATAHEDERTTSVVEGLKELALDNGIAVLAIVAADKAGVGVGRTRLYHVRGSTALLYEADVALVLNNKFDIVARHHLVYGTTEAAHFKEYLVCSIEKNRGGYSDVDTEFHTMYAYGFVEPKGGSVTEQLLDERVYRE